MKGIPELPNHPKPVGPYSHCVVANGLVFVSGQAPLRPEAKPGEWAVADIGGQTRQCLRNIQSILDELGLEMRSVVRTTVFLADPADFKAMNDAYREFFPEEPPTRSTARLGVDLPGLRVSIDAIAVFEPRQEA
jgi:2-iminobutanoate/2-iminopropanoate deaminase